MSGQAEEAVDTPPVSISVWPGLCFLYTNNASVCTQSDLLGLKGSLDGIFGSKYVVEFLELLQY